VLFYDPDGRNVWDSNGDGKLTAADADFAKFKVMVTNADGSQSVLTLTQLGITEINLTADATNIQYADGSAVTDQTTFTRANNTTGTVANMVLATEATGHAVTTVVSSDVNGSRVVVNTAYGLDGSIGHITKSVTSTNGLSITNSFDHDGDGVWDQVQGIATTVNAGIRTETVTNSNGGGILLNRVQTITNATGSSITINRDSTGGGWYDQAETRITNGDGSRTFTISDKNAEMTETWVGAIQGNPENDNRCRLQFAA
jgi:hypothetical protein